MRIFGGIVLTFVLASCTASNPRSCKDGLCTDQEFPFCDVDGSISGTPETCVAVLCTPSEVGGCRGDSELVCNAKGNDYDLVDCAHGCGPDGCKECSANEHCPTAKPVCSASGSCRTCALDDECGSSVCEAGSCVSEASILYAGSSGSTTSSCTHAAPCTPARAISLARMAAVSPVVRMLPGAYAQGLLFDGPSASLMSVVASGATVIAGDALIVKNGANVGIRGLSVMGLSFAVQCGEQGQPKSSLALRDVSIGAGSSTANLIAVDTCTLNLEVADVNLNASTGTAIGVASDSTFRGNRLRVRGDAVSQIAGVGSRIDMRITNSLLENVSTFLSNFDSTGSGSSMTFGYDTMLLASAFQLDCSAGTLRTVVYDNNIVVGKNVTNVAGASGCTVRNNVLFPQSAAAPSNIIADPQFVDPATGDLHLKATSPGVDTAAATLTFPAAEPDYEGTARPQGPKADIGAYERKP